MSPVVFPPDTAVAICQISPGITDGRGAVCIFSSESIFSTGYNSLCHYSSSCFFCLKRPQNPKTKKTNTTLRSAVNMGSWNKEDVWDGAGLITVLTCG